MAPRKASDRFHAERESWCGHLRGLGVALESMSVKVRTCCVLETEAVQRPKRYREGVHKLSVKDEAVSIFCFVGPTSSAI